MYTITIKGDDNLDELERHIYRFKTKLLRNSSLSLTKNITNNIRAILDMTPDTGVSGNLRGKWEIHTKQLDDSGWEISVSNPNAPYVNYLNEPNGAYPLPIDTALLFRWVMTNLSGTDAEKSKAFNTILTNLQNDGHKYKMYKGFIDLALDLTLQQYNNSFDYEVDQAFS